MKYYRALFYVAGMCVSVYALLIFKGMDTAGTTPTPGTVCRQTSLSLAYASFDQRHALAPQTAFQGNSQQESRAQKLGRRSEILTKPRQMHPPQQATGNEKV